MKGGEDVNGGFEKGVWRNVSAEFPSPVGEGQGEGIRPHRACSHAGWRRCLTRPTRL